LNKLAALVGFLFSASKFRHRCEHPAENVLVVTALDGAAVDAVELRYVVDGR
jgi:hypothetical protein